MNYQQLYTYLDSRPVEELYECMSNIVGLTRKRCGPFRNLEGDKISTEEDVILASDQLHKILQKHRVAQRIWTEEAVLSKFAPGLIAPTERNATVSSLLRTPKVQSHLILVNAKIEEELHGKKFDRPGVPNSDEDEEVYVKPAKRARTSSDAADQGHANNRSACSPKNYNFIGEPTIVSNENENSDLAVGTPATSSNTSSTGAFNEHDMKRMQHGNTILWDETLDKALFDAVSRHKKSGWSAVAKAVGRGVSADQSRRRWHKDVGPIHQGLKTGTAGWSVHEERRLGELVTQHQLPPAWNKNLQCMYDRTDWTTIGACLGRAAGSCADKWTSLQHGQMKKGSFSLAEDALIERRVAEWGDKGPGLWPTLEKEMNRSNSSIRARWERLTLRTTDK